MNSLYWNSDRSEGKYVIWMGRVIKWGTIMWNRLPEFVWYGDSITFWYQDHFFSIKCHFQMKISKIFKMQDGRLIVRDERYRLIIPINNIAGLLEEMTNFEWKDMTRRLHWKNREEKVIGCQWKSIEEEKEREGRREKRDWIPPPIPILAHPLEILPISAVE